MYLLYLLEFRPRSTPHGQNPKRRYVQFICFIIIIIITIKWKIDNFKRDNKGRKQHIYNETCNFTSSNRDCRPNSFLETDQFIEPIENRRKLITSLSSCWLIFPSHVAEIVWTHGRHEIITLRKIWRRRNELVSGSNLKHHSHACVSVEQVVTVTQPETCKGKSFQTCIHTQPCLCLRGISSDSD